MKIPPCPHCGRPNTHGYTALGNFEPQPGSIGICDVCTGVFELLETGARKVSQAEIDTWPAEVGAKIQKARGCIVLAHSLFGYRN